VRFVLCITGASGVIYGYRTLEVLSAEHEVHLIVSRSGRTVLREEMGLTLEDLKERFPKAVFHDPADMTSPLASGSRLREFRAVLVVPCSTSTLGNIASGTNQNLIHRVCEVALKERVPLLLLIREMPYSKIHLENMLKVTEAGAVVMPASPGFYHGPKTLEDLVDFVVGKVLDQAGVEHNLFRRWRE